jgi:hypothetical protein
MSCRRLSTLLETKDLNEVSANTSHRDQHLIGREPKAMFEPVPPRSNHRNCSGRDFQTRQRSPPPDDDASQGTIQIRERPWFQPRTLKICLRWRHGRTRNPKCFERHGNHREHVQRSVRSQCMTELTGNLTNTSVEQTLLHRQGFFPVTRSDTAQRGQVHIINSQQPPISSLEYLTIATRYTPRRQYNTLHWPRPPFAGCKHQHPALPGGIGHTGHHRQPQTPKNV